MDSVCMKSGKPQAGAFQGEDHCCRLLRLGSSPVSFIKLRKWAEDSQQLSQSPFFK